MSFPRAHNDGHHIGHHRQTSLLPQVCRFMTCQFCGSSSQLIFIGSKSVSVYRHVAGVSAAAHNEVDPSRGVY